MHCIDDKPNGIILSHNADWSGDACIGWHTLDPTPPSLSECWCVGRDLISGRFTLLSGVEPPVNVITRAVALAVETYLRRKLMHTVEDLFIPVRRGEL